MKQTFYSNGKLLITGEYAVLDGAKALALPTRFGQELIVEPGKENTIEWTSYENDGSIWFGDNISFAEINAATVSENPIRNTLIAILHEASLLNPTFLRSEGYVVATRLSFPRAWGLGTSSTLINNIAQWFGIDAYTLLKNSFGGSGYDIACARHDQPIIYHLTDGKPSVQEVGFEPHFKNQLYFVYLNKKQNSKAAIVSYNKHKANKPAVVIEISLITDAVIETTSVRSFCALIENHENIISNILEIPKVKTQLFPDFHGTIKSLGAWGGDFVLAIAPENPTAYFHEKGYEIVIRYNDMILGSESEE